ncbi:MAG: hypothetical protein MOGMAGMI_01535 [Candidatus Omnitrophica bacterium]|nr:hypothetical protein [Candidatus Omnitrophota bacterium]
MIRTYVVVCTGRSGSWYLIDCLNSVPGAAFRGELLNPALADRRPRWFGRPVDAAQEALRKGLSGIEAQARGFKLPLEQLRDLRWPLSRVREACSPNGWIALYREDLLAQYASAVRAGLTGTWARRADEPVVPLRRRAEFRSADFRRYTVEVRRLYAGFEAETAADPVYWVRYEDLRDDAQRVFDGGLSAAIGCPGACVRPTLRRVSDGDPLEVFTNAEEARRWARDPLSRHEPRSAAPC